MDSLQMTGVAGPVEKSAIWFGTALRKRPPTTTKRPEKTTKTMQLKGTFLHFPNKVSTLTDNCEMLLDFFCNIKGEVKLVNSHLLFGHRLM